MEKNIQSIFGQQGILYQKIKKCLIFKKNLTPNFSKIVISDSLNILYSILNIMSILINNTFWKIEIIFTFMSILNKFIHKVSISCYLFYILIIF